MWEEAPLVPVRELVEWITPFVDVGTFQALVELALDQPQVLSLTPSLHTPTPNHPRQTASRCSNPLS